MPKQCQTESFLTNISFVEDEPESFLADVVVAENEPRAKCISRVDTGGWLQLCKSDQGFLSERGGDCYLEAQMNNAFPDFHKIYMEQKFMLPC